MRRPDRNLYLQGFTLAELSVSAGVALALGMLVITLLQSSMTLYVKNFSVNEASVKGRAVSQKLGDKVQNAIQPPTLIDATGAVVVGNGPASGIRCLVPASLSFNRTTGDTAVSKSTLSTVVNSTDLPAPVAGDYVMLQWYDAASGGSGSLFVRILSVSVTGGTATLTFGKTIQAAMNPSPASSAVIKAGHPFQIINNVAFISITLGSKTMLRYYPRAKSIAVDGATAFNNPGNYRELAELMPSPGKTQGLPFSYSSSEQRHLDVDIRSVSNRYDKRSGSSENNFNSLRTQIAFRSILKATEK